MNRINLTYTMVPYNSGASLSIKQEIDDTDAAEGSVLAPTKTRRSKEKNKTLSSRSVDESPQLAPLPTPSKASRSPIPVSTSAHGILSMKQESNDDFEFSMDDLNFNTWSETRKIPAAESSIIPVSIEAAKHVDPSSEYDDSPLPKALGKTLALKSQCSSPLTPIFPKRPTPAIGINLRT